MTTKSIMVTCKSTQLNYETFAHESILSVKYICLVPYCFLSLHNLRGHIVFMCTVGIKLFQTNQIILVNFLKVFSAHGSQ